MSHGRRSGTPWIAACERDRVCCEVSRTETAQTSAQGLLPSALLLQVAYARMEQAQSAHGRVHAGKGTLNTPKLACSFRMRLRRHACGSMHQVPRSLRSSVHSGLRSSAPMSLLDHVRRQGQHAKFQFCEASRYDLRECSLNSKSHAVARSARMARGCEKSAYRRG